MSRDDLPSSQFQKFLETLCNYPRWVKEAIYLYIREDLRKQLDITKLTDAGINDCIYLYIPRLTRGGQTFLENLKFQEGPLDQRLITFVKTVKKQKNLVDIAQDSDWTLKLTCVYVIKAWEKNIILPTYSKTIYATVRLMAGDIDPAEYLARIGRISKEQYAWVAKMQNSQMLSSFDDKAKGDDILINLGYVSEDELNILKGISQIANTKNLFDDPTFSIIRKASDLQKMIIQLKTEKQNLIEEKQELENKIVHLSNEINMHKTEKNRYYKEIDSLKDELKKALKGS